MRRNVQSLFVIALTAVVGFGDVPQFKPGFNLFSKEQDVS